MVARRAAIVKLQDIEYADFMKFCSLVVIDKGQTQFIRFGSYSHRAGKQRNQSRRYKKFFFPPLFPYLRNSILKELKYNLTEFFRPLIHKAMTATFNLHQPGAGNFLC